MLDQELVQQGTEFLVILLGFVLEPLLERTDEAFGDPIGLGPMTSNQGMDELFRAQQGLESVRLEVGSPVTDEEEQVWW